MAKHHTAPTPAGPVINTVHTPGEKLASLDTTANPYDIHSSLPYNTQAYPVTPTQRTGFTPNLDIYKATSPAFLSKLGALDNDSLKDMVRELPLPWRSVFFPTRELKIAALIDIESAAAFSRTCMAEVRAAYASQSPKKA